jgi:hypothetical protein
LAKMFVWHFINSLSNYLWQFYNLVRLYQNK